MIKKSNVKDEMNYHKFRKFQFNNEKVFIKDTFDLKKIHLMIVEFDDKTSDIKIFDI